MGQDLHSAFVRAGIPAPSMALRALIGGPCDDLSYVDLIAELGITMAPVMEEQGVISRGEIDPATFRENMLAEVQRLVHEDEPVSFLNTPLTKWGVSGRIDGVRTSPIGLFLFWPGASSWRPGAGSRPIS